MPKTHTIRKSFSYGGSPLASSTTTRNAVTEANIDQAINDQTYRTEFNWNVIPANILDLSIFCDKNITIYINGTDDVQTWTHPGSGSPTLTFGAQTTTGLPVTSTIAQVQAAFQALSTVGANNANVTGPTGGPYVITFVGQLGLAPQSGVTSSGGSVAHTTTGVVPTQTFNYIAGEGVDWNTANTLFPTCPITSTASKFSVTNLSGGTANLQVYCGLST